MTAILFVAQRVSAMVLAFAVAVHLATILYAVQAGLTAGAILDRTRENDWFLAFYLVFVLAIAVHAPIGLRNVVREWTRWRGLSLDIALAVFAIMLLGLGVRAALAVYLPIAIHLR
jgi:fumarate reductase subunit C